MPHLNNRLQRSSAMNAIMIEIGLPELLMKVDGIGYTATYIPTEAGIGMIPRLSDDENRADELMKYNTNHSVVSFVDSYGCKYVGITVDAIMATLVALGYTRRGEMDVPFSNGEIPVNPKLRLRWQSIQSFCHNILGPAEQRRREDPAKRW